MKRVLPLLALATLLACPLHAQEGTAPQVLSTTTGTTPASPSAGRPHHPGGDSLTPEEREKLRSAHEAALKANPGLDAEGKDLMEKERAYRKKVNDAMIKADPSVAPLIAKMEKMHPHGGPGGPPPPPENGN